MPAVRFGIVGTSGHASRVAAPVLKRSHGVSLLGAAGSAPEIGADAAAGTALAGIIETAVRGRPCA